MNSNFEKDMATGKYLLNMYKIAEEAKDEEMMELIRNKHSKLADEIEAKGKDYVRMFYLIESADNRGNEYIDFPDAIFESEIPTLVEAMRKYGIERFTISSGMSSMAKTISCFQDNGCKLVGIETVNAAYKDFMTGSYEKVPAFVIDVN